MRFCTVSTGSFLLLLLLQAATALSPRLLLKRQIIFGGDGDSNSDQGSGSASTSVVGNGDGLTVLQTLGEQAPDDIGVRLAGGLQGTACKTPDGESGICSFILEPQCSLVVQAIQRNGVTSRVIAYLRLAIADPCGFDSTDYTLCCKSDSVPTPAPTTASATTATPASQATCGFSPFSTRIVGGTEASSGAWPWATILGLPQGDRFKVVCGGSLITNKHVLTASHCFPGGSNSAITHARLGEHDISKTDDVSTKPLDIAIANKKVHENYDSKALKNDIAMVTLALAVQFSSTISPVCLPTGLQGVDFTKRGNPTIIGWGSTTSGSGTTTALRQASVILVPTQKCAADYSSIQRIKIGDDQICAGDGTTDTCTGDSGGPMMTAIDGSRWAVIGVTSFGVGCGKGDFPGVYTRVDNFLTWIAQNSA